MVLPLSAGRAERHGFEYFRHGTLSLYAALDTHTGEVLGKTTAKHTSAEFVAFLVGELASGQPPGAGEIHVIADNLSAHKTRGRVQDFLSAHPHRVHLHSRPLTPPGSIKWSCGSLKIERDVIARGVFTSKADLARKIARYIKVHNQSAKPFKWTYRNTNRRIR